MNKEAICVVLFMINLLSSLWVALELSDVLLFHNFNSQTFNEWIKGLFSKRNWFGKLQLCLCALWVMPLCTLSLLLLLVIKCVLKIVKLGMK